ncbi:MAG TPA: polyprenyl synthetase family protein [Firmicutes bacterium]|nr:polyprenyl synthetase family protein [Bacillota bacterium]
MNLPELQFYKERIEEALDSYLPSASCTPEIIHEAMRYSVCGGGKRLRGALVLIACEVAGGRWQDAMPAACALEMIHAYSLIHDDLPCMDDDELRRGKPTNHRVFGEAIALLAGDALLTQGIATMLNYIPAGLEQAYHRALQELVAASCTQGMIGGQVLDLAAEGKKLTLEELNQIYRWKTGALIRAALRMGALIGKGEPWVLEALTLYGEALGLAFQITDDLLDLEADPQLLGKMVGSDLRKQKATYPGLVGIDEAHRLAAEEIDRACAALAPLAENGKVLIELAEAVLKRNY